MRTVSVWRCRPRRLRDQRSNSVVLPYRYDTGTYQAAMSLFSTDVPENDEPVEPVIEAVNEPVQEPVQTPVVTTLRIVNLNEFAVYVPLASGEVRLGPKEAVVLDAAEVTDTTRHVEGQGAIVIRNQ